MCSMCDCHICLIECSRKYLLLTPIGNGIAFYVSTLSSLLHNQLTTILVVFMNVDANALTG